MSSRKDIRNIFYGILKDKTPAEDRVYKSRYTPVGLKECKNGPAILIYTTREQVEVFQESPRVFSRTLTISVELFASEKTDADNADDVLDDLALAIESIIELEARLQALAGIDDVAKSAVLHSSELGIDGSAERPVFFCKMDFNVVYMANGFVVDAEDMDDFKTAGVTDDHDSVPLDAASSIEIS